MELLKTRPVRLVNSRVLPETILLGRSPHLKLSRGRQIGLIVCNDFGNNEPHSAYLEAFSQIRAPVVFPTAAPNLESRDDIWPTETAPVFRRREDGARTGAAAMGFSHAMGKTKKDRASPAELERAP